ncbi:unnamed protein product, partial [Closterium sp. NIES-64]
SSTNSSANSSASSITASVYIAADVPSTAPVPSPTYPSLDSHLKTSHLPDSPSPDTASLEGSSVKAPSPGGPLDHGSSTLAMSNGTIHSASWASTISAYGGVGNERERLVDAAVQGLQLMRRSIKGTVMIEELLPEAGSYDP